MTSYNSVRRPNSFPALLWSALTILICSSPGTAQEQRDYASERNRAFQLVEASKFTEAAPILEKLVAQNPKDQQVLFNAGFAVLASTQNMADATMRKQARLRARGYLVRAKELGMADALLDRMIDSIPPDGGEEKPSRNTEADAAMQEGEAAFTRGDLSKALAAYGRALQLDPRLYEAPLFAGDMQFKKGHESTDAGERSYLFDQAGEWFAKAIAIDPNRETAYRYWGDALLAQGKNDEARAKYIEAIVAEPYNRLVYAGLTKWAEQTKTPLAHPKIEQPAPTMKSEQSGNQTTVAIDPSKVDPKSPNYYWVFYDLVRATYKTASFPKEYPNEKEYRHSLNEEAAALRMVEPKWRRRI